MTNKKPSDEQVYDPNRMLDAVMDLLKVRTDAALSRMLDVSPPIISKIRHGRLAVGAAILVRLHEETGLPVRELRDLMGDRRGNYRYGDGPGKPLVRPDQD